MRLALPFRALRLAPALLVAVAPAAAQENARCEIRSVRAWSGPDSTRIAVELSRETRWKSARLTRPERVYFDFLDTRPRLGPARIHVVPVGDARVRQARVAMKDPRTTRLVLDLAGEVEYEVSHLTNPERLVVELRLKSAGRPAEAISQAAPEKARPAEAAAAVRPPETGAPAGPDTAAAARVSKPGAAEPQAAPAGPAVRPEAGAAGTTGAPGREPSAPSAATATKAAAPSPADPAPRLETSPPKQEAAPAAVLAAQPARPTRRGERSLTRALGLHIGRVVLDPGHGGHDQGTQGPTGLLEKELVLDVALRLGALIEERLGGEVVYTRRTDEFIPLEERTAIANENRADLFLSIHANSSPVRRVSGAEVFYLNFTTSREALELAARENAGHNRSIFELRELIQKIALKDKLDESREFAGYMQQELSKEWRRQNPAARDRGVKTAPFVVLIGASMPSVLAEIGFLSNPKDEALMKKPEYRQRLAEALYRGIERYARSLGQTQALRAATAPESPQSTR